MVNTKFIINVEKKRYISIIFLNSINTYLMWLMNMFFKKVYNFPMGNKFRAKMSKMIKCPKCGKIFKKPIFGRKRVGVGIGFTALGDYIKCPECNYEGIPSEFESKQQ